MEAEAGGAGELLGFPVPVAGEGARVTVGVTVLEAGEEGVGAASVLEEKDFAVGAADAAHLLKRGEGMRVGAEAEGGDDGVEAGVREGEQLGVGKDMSRVVAVGGTFAPGVAEHIGGKIGESEAAGGRIEAEALAGAGRDFQDVAGGACQQAAAEAGETEEFEDAFDGVVETGDAVVFGLELLGGKGDGHGKESDKGGRAASASAQFPLFMLPEWLA